MEKILNDIGLSHLWPKWKEQLIEVEHVLTYSTDELKDLGVTKAGHIGSLRTLCRQHANSNSCIGSTNSIVPNGFNRTRGQAAKPVLRVANVTINIQAKKTECKIMVQILPDRMMVNINSKFQFFNIFCVLCI